MSTGKWAEKDPERPKLTKRWRRGQKVRFKVICKDRVMVIHGVIKGIYRYFMVVKTEYGYNTCYTFQAAETEVEACT